MTERPRVVAIVQARTGSTRLPGKVLLDLGGQPLLARVLRRTRRAALVDEVVVATSVAPADAAIVGACRALDVRTFRGDEQDVLDRFHRAAIAFGAQAVVRITADCPLIDAGIVDRVVAAFLEARPDYASNTLQRTYPRGLDTEVFSFAALERACIEATQAYQRAHVTPYLYQNPGLFHLLPVTQPSDHSAYRWTVDTPEDLAFVREVYARLGNDDRFSWTDALALLEREPHLADVNRAVAQKALHEG